MANYMSMDNLRFVIYEVLQAKDLCTLERFQDYDKESFDILLQSIKDYCDRVAFPVYQEMDAQAAHYKDGKIIIPPIVGQFIKDMGANGSIGAAMDYEHGGMQLPHLVHSAGGLIVHAANNHLPGYTGLTEGSANLIATFGSQELRDTYVPKMLKGEWTGTMCLTEPQAGSSLSDVATMAFPNEDGSFQIKGQKIFISGGDHEYTENIIHLVLARIDGAPAGTKGISLFVVPKKRIQSDGQLISNDVTTAGDFQKMGQKGYCTTHLAFGENQDCQGWLVGTKNRGLNQMFQMMNAARIDVGIGAAAIASAAYYASLQYAQERPQGRRILNGGIKDTSKEQTLIINHPDVRRMLFLQKAITEGAIALLMQASWYHDMSIAGPEEMREHYHDLLEILTPMAKTYPSEKGRIAINNGLQILGGYGYCTDFPLQQHLRDVRIMALYEGTTGIQSLDLLGRKAVMKNGAAMKALTKEIIGTIKSASTFDDLKPYAEELKAASKEVEAVLMHLLQFAMKGEHERFIADATIFMELLSNVVIAWQWLKMATAAKNALLNGNAPLDAAFYESKIQTMQFYYKYELPQILAAKTTLMRPENLTIREDSKMVFS